MTPAQQPQQEYIITEDQLCILIHGEDDALKCHYLSKDIRSRPNIPAPETDHKAPICENCGKDNTTCRMDMSVCLQAQNTAARAATLAENKRVLDRLDKEIAIRENEMNRKGNLEDNLTTATGYLTSAGALNWVRVVLIDGLRQQQGREQG